jgi:hypothetical protein
MVYFSPVFVNMSPFGDLTITYSYGIDGPLMDYLLNERG